MPKFNIRSLVTFVPAATTFVGYFAVLAFVFAAPPPLRPATIAQGDKCLRCARTIVNPAGAGEIVDRYGVAYKFKAPGCMAQYLNANPEPADRFAGIFVAESTSGLLVPVERAWFVETVVEPRTGERDFIAFSAHSRAEEYATRLGEIPVDWNAVMFEGARRQAALMGTVRADD